MRASSLLMWGREIRFISKCEAEGNRKMPAPIAVIDVGTTKTCALIGEMREGGTLRILGTGVAPSNGLRKGVVVDVNQTAEGIGRAVEQAERVSGFKVGAALVSITGTHIESVNSRGVAGIHGGHGVTAEDVERALESAEAIAVPQNREIINAIPRGYSLDGQDGVKEPLGMVGFRLEVEAHIVTGAAPPIQNLLKAIQTTHIRVGDLVFSPIASGEAALTTAEKEMGVVLADIGGGTTDISIFIDGSVWHTIVLPVGGLNVSNDLAVGLRIPFQAAEGIKVSHGRMDVGAIADDAMVDVAAFGEEGHRPVSQRLMAEIIHARVEEILQLILTEIKRSGYDNLLPAGVVLCGGSANIQGLRTFARDIFQMPVRIATPRGIEGFVDRVSSPGYATAIGLLFWGAQKGIGMDAVRARNQKDGPSVFGELFGWAKKAFLPG